MASSKSWIGTAARRRRMRREDRGIMRVSADGFRFPETGGKELMLFGGFGIQQNPLEEVLVSEV